MLNNQARHSLVLINLQSILTERIKLEGSFNKGISVLIIKKLVIICRLLHKSLKEKNVV